MIVWCRRTEDYFLFNGSVGRADAAIISFLLFIPLLLLNFTTTLPASDLSPPEYMMMTVCWVYHLQYLTQSIFPSAILMAGRTLRFHHPSLLTAEDFICRGMNRERALPWDATLLRDIPPIALT